MVPRRTPPPQSADAARVTAAPAVGTESAAQPGALWVQITGAAAGTNRYAWTQLDEGDTSAFGTGLSTEFAASGTSAEDGGCAREINGRTDVPTDGSARVRLRPAGDLTYYVFEYAGPPADAGGNPSCVGCGWVAGLRAEDCLSVTVDGTLSALVLATDGSAETWTDAGTVAICTVAHTVSFSRNAGGVPQLTITQASGSGTAYTGQFACCGCSYAVFTFPLHVLCPATEYPGDPCANVVSVRVAWTCCEPIAGFDGAGWYCVRAAGTSDDCAPVELLAADRCDDTIEICSGPYATEAEAGTCAEVAPGLTCLTAPDVAAGYGGGPYDVPGDAGATRNWFRLTGLTPGTDYHVTVTAGAGGSLRFGSYPFTAPDPCTALYSADLVSAGATQCFTVNTLTGDGLTLVFYAAGFAATTYTFSVAAGACP